MDSLSILKALKVRLSCIVRCEAKPDVFQRGSQPTFGNLQGNLLIQAFILLGRHLIAQQLYVPDIRAFVANSESTCMYHGISLCQHCSPLAVAKPATTTLCTGKIKYVKSGYLPQFEALKKLVQPEEVKNIKLTLVAPEWFHLRHGASHFLHHVNHNSMELIRSVRIQT